MASLLESEATWNVLAQQVMMGMVGRVVDEGAGSYSMDQWPGYARGTDAPGRIPGRPPGPQPGRAHRGYPFELGQ